MKKGQPHVKRDVRLVGIDPDGDIFDELFTTGKVNPAKIAADIAKQWYERKGYTLKTCQKCEVKPTEEAPKPVSQPMEREQDNGWNMNRFDYLRDEQ